MSTLVKSPYVEAITDVKTHTCKDGTSIKITEMTTEHIVNTIKNLAINKGYKARYVEYLCELLIRTSTQTDIDDELESYLISIRDGKVKSIVV
jgi:hypothetical protein